MAVPGFRVAKIVDKIRVARNRLDFPIAGERSRSTRENSLGKMAEFL